MVYICPSFWLLAVKSRDLSQDEKKTTVAKAEQVQKMTITFTQNDKFWPFWVEMIIIFWICSCLTTVTFFSAWDKSCDPTANTQSAKCRPPYLPVWPSKSGIKFASSLDCCKRRLISSGVALSFSKTLTKVRVTGRNLSLSSSVMRLTSESGKAPKVNLH